MKNFLLALMLFATNSAFAQTWEMMEFKGVRMTGDVYEFSRELVKKGYSLDEEHDNYVILSGDFAGEECSIMTCGSLKTNTIYAVHAFFPERTTWPQLKNNYNKLKLMLTEKYGTPNKSIQEFLSPFKDGAG
ncbi:MAG: hypothetical protein ACRDCN_11205, partial [Tannerellaceae bacterium]